MPDTSTVSRRDLLKLALTGAAVSSIPPAVRAAVQAGVAGDQKFAALLADFAD
ncbi:MAG: hypothetical protein ACJ8LG_06225 [Massilia sp.]